MKSPWISIKKRLPKTGRPVDLWTDEGERLPNYSLFIDFDRKKGNNFFYPINYGVCCVRFDGNKYTTQATHWMYPPAAPKAKD